MRTERAFHSDAEISLFFKALRVRRARTVIQQRLQLLLFSSKTSTIQSRGPRVPRRAWSIVLSFLILVKYCP